MPAAMNFVTAISPFAVSARIISRRDSAAMGLESTEDRPERQFTGEDGQTVVTVHTEETENLWQ